jgi:hypothetical protein
VFDKPEWVKLGSEILHRFAVTEQTRDGYWGEHSRAGPTTGYDHLTLSAVALYGEYSHDPAILQALRRSTDFHMHFTYPDGTPVETINDRNRYWSVSPGHDSPSPISRTGAVTQSFWRRFSTRTK